MSPSEPTIAMSTGSLAPSGTLQRGGGHSHRNPAHAGQSTISHEAPCAADDAHAVTTLADRGSKIARATVRLAPGTALLIDVAVDVTVRTVKAISSSETCPASGTRVVAPRRE